MHIFNQFSPELWQIPHLPHGLLGCAGPSPVEGGAPVVRQRVEQPSIHGVGTGVCEQHMDTLCSKLPQAQHAACKTQSCI